MEDPEELSPVYSSESVVEMLPSLPRYEEALLLLLSHLAQNLIIYTSMLIRGTQLVMSSTNSQT